MSWIFLEIPPGISWKSPVTLSLISYCRPAHILSVSIRPGTSQACIILSVRPISHTL